MRNFETLTKGAGELIGIPAQTIQGVGEEYVDRRRATRKLRWRGMYSLGSIPFKNQTIVFAGSAVRFNGHKVRLLKHRDIGGRIRSGNFAQDARGRWYCSLVRELEIRPHGKIAPVGIDLGLKGGIALSTGVKMQVSD
jgi:transposase